MVDSVGRWVVKALLHPEAGRNCALKINSFTHHNASGYCGRVQVAEGRTGGEKWSVSYLPLEKAREVGRQAHAEKNPGAVGFTLRRIWTEGGRDVVGEAG